MPSPFTFINSEDGEVVFLTNSVDTFQQPGSFVYDKLNKVLTLYNVAFNGVHYIWPDTQGAANSFLKNDGTGILTWAFPPGGVSSVSNSDGTLTISPTTTAVIASLNLGHANSWSAAQTFTTSGIILAGAGKNTIFASLAATSDKTITFPNLTAIVITNGDTGTVTNTMLAGSITAAKLVGTDIATVGTITSGTWNGTTIAIAHGGTGQTTASAAFDALSPMTTLGDVIYGGTSGTNTRLAGNTTSTKKFLRQTGTGSVSAAPAWDTVIDADVVFSDITTGNVSISAHGYTPKAPNDTTKFLRGDATWQTIPGAAGSLISTSVLTTTSSSTYTVPANVHVILVQLVGAGSGGGGINCSGSNVAAAGGGGAGGYSEKLFTVTPGDMFTYACGGGGAGGSAGFNNGSNGGTTSFDTMQGVHGVFGIGSNGSATVDIVSGGAGGTATNGILNLTAAAGKNGLGVAVSGTPLLALSGAGGDSWFGYGGAAISSNAGADGVGYGSGGSGASATTATTAAGGNGMQGLIVVYEYN